MRLNWNQPPIVDQANAAITGGNTPYMLAYTAIPLIIAPTGTMANNGAITLGTALPLIYPNCYLYLPAGAIAAGVPAAATFYFAQMSSTTVGTVFNNTFSGTFPASGVLTIPASPTAFATTGPGAYTGATTEVTITANVPANIGASGGLRIYTHSRHLNSVGTKTVRHKLGSTVYIAFGANSTGQAWVDTDVANAGSTQKQIGWSRTFADNGVANTAADVQGTTDTTAATTAVASLQIGTATDYQLFTLIQMTLYAPGQ